MAAQDSLLLAIIIAAGGVVTAIGGLAALYSARQQSKKIPSEIHHSDVQAEKLSAETAITRRYGSGDGSLIERIEGLAERALARQETLELKIAELKGEKEEDEQEKARLRGIIRQLHMTLQAANIPIDDGLKVVKDIKLIQGKDG